MKKQYQSPEVKIIAISAQDIIATSGPIKESETDNMDVNNDEILDGGNVNVY